MEKTPGHALYIPEIMQLLPSARIIHIVRDPRDTVASLLAASKGWGRRWAPNRAKKAAQVWVKHVSEARAAAVKVPTGNYVELSYEKLCANPADELRALVHFLHLKWSDEEIAAAVATNSADALRQDKGTKIPLQGEMAKRASHLKNPDGFVRKARPGTWREDLSPLQKWQMWCVLRKSPDARPFLKE